jgi:hypothetical protein
MCGGNLRMPHNCPCSILIGEVAAGSERGSDGTGRGDEFVDEDVRQLHDMSEL